MWLREGQLAVSCEYGSELAGLIKYGKFFEKLKNRSLSRRAALHGFGWFVGWRF